MIVLLLLSSMMRKWRRPRRRPQIEVILTPSDEVQRLRAEISRLEGELEKLRLETNRAQALYGQECVINLSLQDLLRENGIPFRR